MLRYFAFCWLPNALVLNIISFLQVGNLRVALMECFLSDSIRALVWFGEKKRNWKAIELLNRTSLTKPLNENTSFA